MQIDAADFYLRPLKPSDATETYLGWFRDTSAQKYIVTARENKTVENLAKYIADKIGKENVLFLGIFDKNHEKHIGNIKFEPIDTAAGYAILGILIGNPEYRGRKVASITIKAAAAWLKMHRGIHRLLLGVHADNIPAIKAYESIGFQITQSDILKSDLPENLVMAWEF